MTNKKPRLIVRSVEVFLLFQMTPHPVDAAVRKEIEPVPGVKDGVRDMRTKQD